jgi:hypothetical protein
MLSVKVRIYLFYVAAVFFAAIGLWMIGAGLFGSGGFTALVIGGLMFATGVVDYAMGSYLQRLYLQPAQSGQAMQPGQPGQPDSGSGSTGSPGGSNAG